MLGKIWSFLGSVRFVIVLLIILAIVSVVGILIPQGLPAQNYVHKLGSFRSSIVLAIGLDHLFSTLWFYSLLGFLSLSVVSCSTTRLWKNFLESGRHHFLKSSADVQSLKFTSSFNARGAAPAVRDVLLKNLRGRLFGCSVQQLANGFQISAKSGRLKDIGSLMFHLSLIVLFVGGLVGKLGGFSVMQELGKGETAPVPGHDFRVRCDWFTVEKNEDGRVKDYKSKLAIVRSDGSTAVDKVIEVNSPLTYGGVRFYQSSYGEEPDRFSQAALKVVGPEFDSLGYDFTAAMDSTVVLAGSGISARAVRFVPDFIIDTETRQVQSRSSKPNNPAVQVLLTRGADTLSNSWAFVRYPDAHMGKGDYRIAFLGYEPQFYTGIQIKEDPGLTFIWIGLFCMTLGIIFLFYVPRTSLWLFVESDDGDSCRVTMGGTSNRHPSAFQEEFDKMCASFGSALKGRT